MNSKTGENIRRVRIRKGMSQKALGRKGWDDECSAQ